MVNGWQTATKVSVKEMLNIWLAHGISEVFITDVQSDGAMAGPAVGLYSEVLEAFPELRLIASGGVSSEDDVLELDRIGCSAAIVGKAIYEGAISLETLAKYVG